MADLFNFFGTEPDPWLTGGGSVDSGAASVLYPQTSTVFVPGSDVTTVPTADPNPSNSALDWLQSAAKTAAVGIGGIVGGVKAYDDFQVARDQRAFDKQMQSANLQLKQAQLQSQNAIDLARINAQTITAQKTFGNMPGLSYLFGGNAAPASTGDKLMLLLTAVGVYYAWKAAK